MGVLKNENSYINNVQQYEQSSEIKPVSNYYLFKDAQNWQDYYSVLELEKKIDSIIIESEYFNLYRSVDKISSEDAIAIYFYVKERIQFKEVLPSNIMLFVLLMEILGVRIKNVFAYVPVDEEIIFRRELKDANLEIISGLKPLF